MNYRTLSIVLGAILIIVIAFLVLHAFGYTLSAPTDTTTATTTATSTVSAPAPVTTTSVTQSTTTVTQPAPSVTYHNASSDQIRVAQPAAGAVLGKSFTVTGQARGSWYFEASFPVKLLDANGTVIASGSAKAESDWMTTDFVPFNVDLTAPASYSGRATIVLSKDNPSGLPQNDASLSVPITIES